MRRPLLASMALLLPLVAARAGDAEAPPTLSGSWTASPLTERWTIAEWGEACGPRPRPQGAPGGAVQIRQQGSELSISGAGRAWSTAECWEQMPGLSRSKHSASGNARSWQTRCTTAANDPRRAAVVTTTTATDTAISMAESGQYQFIIQDTTCSASVTRSRTYTLVRREGEAPPAASSSADATPPLPASAPEPPPPAPAASEVKPATPRLCDAPGEPARLEVTPSRKLMRPGERFQFRASVMDAEGCALSMKPSWSIAPGPLAAQASVDPSGVLSVAEAAGEGKLGLVATIGGKGVTVSVEVANPERYDALLATRGLNDAGESDVAAAAVIATGTIGGRTTAGEDLARERKNVFVAIVGGVAACLGFAGLVLLRRGRRRPVASAEGAEAALDEVADEGAEAPPRFEAPGAAARDVGAAARAAERPAAMPRGKICPTCGERYPGEAMFCGKDGTQLMPLN